MPSVYAVNRYELAHRVVPPNQAGVMRKVNNDVSCCCCDSILVRTMVVLTQKDPGFFEKGNISNIATFVIMVAGIAMRFGMDIDWDQNVAGRCDTTFFCVFEHFNVPCKFRFESSAFELAVAEMQMYSVAVNSGIALTV